ncbi:hypothetical protein JCM8547_006491 [Rhodosporidiobolus lusitaniae]
MAPSPRKTRARRPAAAADAHASPTPTISPAVLRRFPLVHLPLLALHIIFKNALTSRNLTICKALLPVALEVIWKNVRLCSGWQIAEFAASLARQPQMGRAVKWLQVEDQDQDQEMAIWGEEGVGPGLLSGIIRARQIGLESYYAPDQFLGEGVGVGLLQDIVRHVPELRVFTLIGLPLLDTFFDPHYFFPLSPLPHLHNLSLVLVGDEEWDDENAASVIARVAAGCPSLQSFSLHHNELAGDLPVDYLNVGKEVYLAPRSWTSIISA